MQTKCRICKKPIEAGAIKCTECDSFQNWRRFFDFSSVALSLLIAFFSVLTVAVPNLKSLFTRDQSKLALSAGVLEKASDITLVCYNRGTRPAVVYKACLRTGDGVSPAQSWDLSLPDTHLLLEAATTKVLVLHILVAKNTISVPKEAMVVELTILPFARENSLVTCKLKRS